MRPRFFVPDLDPDRREAELPPEEAHHLARVLRLQTGDEIGVFDGRGREFAGRVAAIGRGSVTVSLLDEVPTPSPAVPLTLVQAILKGTAMDDVVRDATMAGAAAIQPVVSARTTVRAASLPKAWERWNRIALASAKQCGRATLPRLEAPVPFPIWLDRRGTELALLLTEPSLASNALTIRDLVARPGPPAAAIVVGPEGGWTPDEHAAAIERGCVPLTLGPLTLRAAAVPMTAVAVLTAIWNE